MRQAQEDELEGLQRRLAKLDKETARTGAMVADRRAEMDEILEAINREQATIRVIQAEHQEKLAELNRKLNSGLIPVLNEADLAAD
jgi:hypothetical protein